MGFRPNTKGNPRQPKTGVGKAYKAKKRYIKKARKMPAKKLVRRNAYTVASLLKRVRINELNAHGKIQTNKQTVFTIPLPNVAYGSLIPDVRTQFPILFNASNVASQGADLPINNTTRCPIFQMRGAAGAAVPTEIADFQRFNFVGISAPVEAIKSALWVARNEDIPDTGQYYLQSSSYRFTVTCREPTRISFMFFTQKPMSVPASTLTSFNHLLPGGLDGLNSMCTGNYLPKTGFKIYKQYSKTLDPQHNQTSTVSTFYFNFDHERVINQFETKPATADTNIPYGLTGWNYKNTPALQPLWCLVSSSMVGSPNNVNGEGVGTPVYVTCNRTVKWRDQIGADA